MPKLTVLMPAYNASDYIRNSVESVLRSNTKDLELIVLDDGSTDCTIKILDAIKASESRVQILQTANAGTAKARMRLVDASFGRSKYIAWADADDIQHVSRFCRQIEYLEEHQDVLGVGSWAQSFGLSSGFVHRPCRSESVTALALFGAPVVFPTFTIRSAVHEELGVQFDDSIESSEDYDYVSKCLEKGKIANVRRRLTQYRRHLTQESTANRERQLSVHQSISRRNIESWLGWRPQQNELEVLIHPKISEFGSQRVLGVIDRIFDHAKSTTQIDKHALAGVISYRIMRFNQGRWGGVPLVNRREWFSFSEAIRYVISGPDR